MTGDLPRIQLREDIDGLRGLSILLVVLFHARIPGFSGGFVGVDVFFTISGYLITQKLVVEAETTGSVQLRSFWAKRVRRLVPVLTLVAVTVMVASLVVMSPLEWSGIARDGAFSVAYLSNLVFGAQRTRYFIAEDSVFLHTWSLSVEEQFYLGWPLLMLLAARVGVRRRWEARSVAAATILAGSIVSVALSVALSNAGTPWAFFSLPTRVWEFGVGGSLACLRSMSVPTGVRRLLGPAGLAAVLASALEFDARTVYPGIAAVLPVGGCAAVIASGIGPSAIEFRALVVRPAQWVGRASYSWYLWHWPVIVLSVAATGEASVRVTAVAALASLGIAVATLHLVENPLRFCHALRSSDARTFGFAVASTVLVLVSALGLAIAARRAQAQPFYRELAEASAAAADNEGRATAGCRDGGRELGGCLVGSVDSTDTIVLVGDSHAAHWAPAFDVAGRRLGLRVLVRSRGNCPAPDVQITALDGPVRSSPGCNAFREETKRLLADVEPAAVIVSNSGAYVGRIVNPDGGVPSVPRQLDLWKAAYERYLDDLENGGSAIGIILDNPQPPFDPLACIGRRGDVSRCTVSTNEAMDRVRHINDVDERAAAESGPYPMLDLRPTICPDDWCRLKIDGVYVYSDGNHLTTRFVASRSNDVEAFLRRVLDKL